MSKTVKATLIAGAIILCIGIVAVLVAGISNGWNFDTLKWEEKSYECEQSADITDIDLRFDAGKLKIEFYDGETIKVEYSENERLTYDVEVVNRTLSISADFHWHLQFLWFNRFPETKVYIPKDMSLGLKMEINAGAITVSDGTFNDVDVKINAGVISMNNLNCNSFNLQLNAGAVNIAHLTSQKNFVADINAGALDITRLVCDDISLDLSAGAANLTIAGKKSDYTIRTEVSAGSCNVRSQSGGSKRLDVDVSAGSANINFAE